jgi:hypothetical protein
MIKKNVKSAEVVELKRMGKENEDKGFYVLIVD